MSVPPSALKTPPPEPAAPVARLSRTRVSVVKVTRPPALKTPPPPWSASSPSATLPATSVERTTISPVPFQSAPPSRAAVLPVNAEADTSLSPAPVMWMAPPLPGAPPVVLPVKVAPYTLSPRPAPDWSSMAPPARRLALPVNDE